MEAISWNMYLASMCTPDLDTTLQLSHIDP